jgi:flagellar basal body rod protein FlgG
MLISDATMRALDTISARERDLLQAFTPGAFPEKNDVAAAPASQDVGDPLSAAPPDNAYFVVRDEQGRALYTRDGAFGVRDGALVDSQGRWVLGYRDGTSALEPLRADPIDVAYGFAGAARIESDGSVTYERTTIDPRTGRREPQRETFGQIALARFAPGTSLRAVDPAHAAATPGIAPHLGKAGDGCFGAIRPSARACSGIDIDLGLQRLQEAYLSFDAIHASVTANGGIEKTTMDLLK